MRKFLLLMGLAATVATATAQEEEALAKDVNITKSGRLTVGGYGEVVFNRAFFK